MRNILFVIVGLTLFSGIAERGYTQTQSDNALVRKKIFDSPEIWEINKSLTNSEFGIDLFHYPRSGVFAYDKNTTNNTIRSSLLSVIDQSWNRMIYSDMGEDYIKSFGTFGTGSCQYRWPQSIAAHALSDGVTSTGTYDIYIADTYNDRICKAFFIAQSNTVICSTPITGNGLYKPIDIAIDNGGTYVDNSDDKIWVLNDNNKLLRFSHDGVLEYTIDLPAYLKATAVAYDNINTYGPYVAMANTEISEIWEYYYAGYIPEYIPDPNTTKSATFSVVDLQFDALGHLWALDDENGVFIKYYEFYPEPLCKFGSSGTGTNQFSMPSGFSIAAGPQGSGDMFIMEDWTATTGIQHYAIGTDVIDIEVNSNHQRSMHDLNFILIDPSEIEIAIYTGTGQLVVYLWGPGGYMGTAGYISKIWDGTDDNDVQVPTGDYTYNYIMV